ncbi:MAG: hypothetical protein ACFFFH_20665 [Candidatus Thorarchaeota archaeon]
MKLKFNFIKFIHENGNSYHKLKLINLLGSDYKEIDSLINDIKSFQKIDVSWPWKWQYNKPSGVVETISVIEVLSKYEFPKVKQAIPFLCSIQREDGGWSENPRLASYIPYDWIFWRTDVSSAFFTEIFCLH